MQAECEEYEQRIYHEIDPQTAELVRGASQEVEGLERQVQELRVDVEKERAAQQRLLAGRSSGNSSNSGSMSSGSVGSSRKQRRKPMH